MGIKGLKKLIADKAPHAIRQIEMKSLFGRIIAIDASMCLYQYLVAVRSNGFSLTAESGETTSHIVGLLYRTVKLLEQGVKPVFVFDGEAPEMKGDVLVKRRATKADAAEKCDAAKEDGDAYQMLKNAKKAVKVTGTHVQDAKMLFDLMGIPYIEAPAEAEAQCAELCRMGLAYAVASEDMDTVTFGAPVLLKHLTFSEARKIPIGEIKHKKVLEGLSLTNEQFVDLCILLGCDYCTTIKGVGPSKALELIGQYKSIECVLEHLGSKYTPDENWPYQQARSLFHQPTVVSDREFLQARLVWKEPQRKQLHSHLHDHCGFSDDRIASVIERMDKTLKKGIQCRIDSFFKKQAK